MSKILVSIYTHPELYPPTLNAITSLAKEGYKVEVLCNNVLETCWEYHENITITPIGKYVPIREAEQKSTLWKILRWIKFNYFLWQKVQKATVFIAYDTIPLLSFYIISFFLIRSPKITWYHNHDISEVKDTRKYSISWLAAKLENKVMTNFNIFSLPALERKKYFDLDKFKGDFFFLPNFPLKSFFQQFNQIKRDHDFIKIIYQGSIGTGHGLEEICNLLPITIADKKVKLVLKGFIRPTYKEELMAIAKKKGALDYLEFIGITPYQEVPTIASSCHIGIAIFTKQDTMNRTLGTASNKIYEYAACGLPILYFDDEHYKRHLGEYPWAFPTDLSEQSIIDTLERIMNSFDELSKTAKEAFNAELNFETHFSNISSYLSSKLEQ